MEETDGFADQTARCPETQERISDEQIQKDSTPIFAGSNAFCISPARKQGIFPIRLLHKPGLLRLPHLSLHL